MRQKLVVALERPRKDVFAASGAFMTPWDCPIFGINSVTMGESRGGSSRLLDLITFAFTFEAGAPASIDYGISKFLKLHSVKYDFLKFDHRVFLGKKMAEFLRANR